MGIGDFVSERCCNMELYNVGQEVIIKGPNIWGQWIFQGNKGKVVGYAFGAITVKIYENDRETNYPMSSLVQPDYI